jgi:hypothetical protein
MTADRWPENEGEFSPAHCGIEVHIEQLVLHGFAPGDRHRVGAAVERELTVLLAAGKGLGLLRRDAEVAHVAGEAFDVPTGARPETIGAQMARAVYRGLTSGGQE